MAPSDGRTQGDLFQHAKADIPIKAGLHLVLPMDGDVDGQGLGVALGSTFRDKGGPAIMGRGWCSQTLNALAEYRSSKWLSSL